MTGTATYPMALTSLFTSADVQVWSASLDQPDRCLDKLTALLAPDEIERAARFTQQFQGRRFMAGRAMLRMLLSCYVDVEPAQIPLAYGAHGKPEIADSAGEGIHFNVSHSRDRVVFAVARGRRVGVDIEYVRPV